MSKVMRWDGPPPYLSAWDLISLAWIRASILALLIIGFALWIGATTAVEGIQDAKNALTEACAASEKVATVAANLPHYVAKVVNDQLNAAIIDSIQAAHKALELLLDAMTAIVKYFLEIVNGVITFVFQFIIGGILSAIADMTASAQQVLNSAMGGIADGIQSSIASSVSGVNSAIDTANRAISTYNNIPFVPDISLISHVTIPFDVSSIRNFQVPNTASSSISALSSRLPNLDSLISSIDTTIGAPVQALEREMNATFANITAPNVNITLPQVAAVQYCNKINIGFLDELGDDILWAMRVGLGILAGIALLIFLAHAFFIWIMWRIQLRGDARATKFWSQAGAGTGAAGAGAAHQMSEKKSEGPHDEPVASTSQSTAPTYAVIPLTRHNILALDNPFSTWAAASVLSLFSFLHPSQVAHDRLAWFFAYIFSIHPMICFVIGLFGVVALALQLILINIVRGRINREVSKLVDEVVDAVGGAVNALISNVGGEVASGLNTALGGIDTAVNQDLNGWISTAVGAYANAMRSFYTTLTDGISNTFRGSFLETPMRTLVQAIVGNQASGLSDAQTYLQQNLHISVPRIDSKVFLLSNGTLDDISNTLAKAAIGGDDGSQGVFGLIFDRYTKLLKNLMILFGALLGIWGFIVLMGLVILLLDIIRHPHAGRAATGDAEKTSPEISEKTPVKKEVDEPEINEKSPVKKENEEPTSERDVVETGAGESPAPVKTEKDVEADAPVTKSSGKGLRRFLPFLSHNARPE